MGKMIQKGTKKRKTRRIWAVLSVFILIVLAVGLRISWTKRIGIVNTISRLTGLQVSYRLIDGWKQSFSYDTQIVKAEPAREHAILISEDDESARVETTIPRETSLIAQTYEIDQMLEEELCSGYDWEEPLAVVDPYGFSPLTAVILFDTPQECSVRYIVKGKTPAADLNYELSDVSCQHRVPVVGLYPDFVNTVEIELLGGDGNVISSQELELSTDSIPEKLVNAVQPVRTAGESAMGLTLVSGQQSVYPYAYDCMGDIRWYLNWEADSVYPLSNDRILVHDEMDCVPSQEKPMGSDLYETDYLGRFYKLYYMPAGSHHEVIEKEPGGNLMVLTSSMDMHIEDRVCELDRQSGEIVSEMNLLDVLGSDFYEDRADWAHLNTISYQPEEDTVILSPRNLESAVKIGWTNHELIWIMGDPRFWKKTKLSDHVLKPEGDFIYHFQQHSVYQLAEDLDGNDQTVEIMMFDNHHLGERKNQIHYFDDPDASYVLVYAVNEKEKTVSQIKKLPMVHSTITSNVVFDGESGRIFGMCGHVDASTDGRYGMIYEFDYDTGEVINQFSIKDTFYRAIEMKVDIESLAEPMEKTSGYIGGMLWAPVEAEDIKKEPTGLLQDEISLSLRGNTLRVGVPYQYISQMIFKGETHSYVYDVSDIRLYEEEYLAFPTNMPIPLAGLSADMYQIWCVYKGELCSTGQSVQIL